MKTHRSSLHATLFTLLLTASGCGAFAAGSVPSDGAGAAAWRMDAGTGAGDEAGFRMAPPILRGNGSGRAAKADAPFIRPLPQADTVLEPGALLDVWMNDRRRDLRTITSERSLGTAVARGDFFRYSSVNSDPDLRGFWGQQLVLKWSALLEIKEQGQHVFVSELSRERTYGALSVRTLVRLNEETLFEKEVREFGHNQISEVGTRVLTLSPGFYRLEVWLAVQNARDLAPATQLGTYIRVREPGVMTAELLPLSRLWHRVQ